MRPGDLARSRMACKMWADSWLAASLDDRRTMGRIEPDDVVMVVAVDPECGSMGTCMVLNSKAELGWVLISRLEGL